MAPTGHCLVLLPDSRVLTSSLAAASALEHFIQPLDLSSETARIAIDKVSLRFGGVSALDGVTLEIAAGALHALIGPNGAGKTSLLNCISGLYRASGGSISLQDSVGGSHRIDRLAPHRIARLGIARTFQNIELFRHMTVLENLTLGRHVHMRGGVLSGGLYWGRQKREEVAHRRSIEEVIDFLELQGVRRQLVGNLSYGQQKLVELGRALAAEPTFLLLDEPMAGMNAEEKEAIARYVLDVYEEWGVTPVVIDHDMDVLMDICDRVAVLDFGRLIAVGSPEEVRGNRAVIDAYLGEEIPA
jgi:branched-chain amino acid transport system ATP-binding protein